MSSKSTCRLCLSTEGGMEEIFSSSDSEFHKRIYECTSIEIKNVPGLPSCVCEVCKSELIIWYKFRRQCIKSNEILKTKFPVLFKDANPEELCGVEREDESLEVFEIINEEDCSNNSEQVNCSEEQTYSTVDVYCNEDNSSQEIFESSRELDISALNPGTLTDDDNNESNENEIIIEACNDPESKENQMETYENVVLKIFDGDRVRYHKFCSICGKMQQNLKQHMLIHSDKKPFQCPHCGRGFRQRSNFKHHVYTHTGEKPYMCILCEKRFADPASLRSHTVIHTGERRFRCEYCNSAFGHSHTLAAHRRIHTQDRRHKCEYCGKSFLSKHALKKHVRTHTGEKPYECGVCRKTFTTSGNLSTHKRVHTKERPFTCNVCRLSFGYKSVLVAHMKTH